MKIVIDEKQFEDKKQALFELAFCHYPVTVEIDEKILVFECFSAVEKYLNDLKD